MWSTIGWNDIRQRYRRSVLGPLWITLSMGILVGTLFAQMLPQAHRGLRRATAEAVRLIDSTSVRLSSLSEGWATLHSSAARVKLSVRATARK